MPALEALHHQFHEAHTVVMGVSVDSVYCHANWARSLGGISFPLLADFHPKGKVAEAYGLYLEKAGITDRATVIICAGGTVRHISSVTPAGKRDMNELLELAKKVDAEYQGDRQDFAHPRFPDGTKLYVKSSCGFSASVLMAVENLHLKDKLEIFNCSENAKAMEELKQLTDKEQAPCLLLEGKPMLESADIIKKLAALSTGF